MITVSNFILYGIFLILQATHSIVEPRRKLTLTQRIAPRNGSHTLPALVKEIRKILLRLARTILSRLGHQSRSTTSAQLALTSSHTHSRTAAQIDQIMHIQLIERILHFAN